MRQFVCFLSLIFVCILCTQSKVLYECNFDNATLVNNCFLSPINVASNVGNPISIIPNGALSDVTSSLKPTQNGEQCKLPYKVGSFSWDMYFCNKGYCPTATSMNSTCKAGKFGSVQLLNSDKKSYKLKTVSDGIDGVGEQCLIYYYYMANLSSRVINVTKEEKSGSREIIDSVTSSPFNGWIQRKISFIAQARGYNVYFEAQKISGFQSPFIGFDEISIYQGKCDDQHTTYETMTATSMLIEITTTTVTPEISKTTSKLVETTSTTTTTTTVTTREPIETATTIISESAETIAATTITSTAKPFETTTATLEPLATTTQIVTQTGLIETTTTTTTITIVTSELMETTVTTTTTITTAEPFETATSTLPAESTSVTPSTSTTTTTTTTSTTEISTVSSSESKTTTTTITSSTTITLSTTLISAESTTTIPSTSAVTSSSAIPETTYPTITVMTSMTTTTSTVDNVIIASYKQLLPREKHHIIILAIIIPIVWIAFIASFVWAKRSSGVINGILHPFTNWSGTGENASSSYELTNVSDA